MIIQGNAINIPLADCSVQCVVTSPPYYGLRDYGVEGQIGLESTPEKFVNNLVLVFREVWRVLKDDGVLWLNLGDSYAGSGCGTNDYRTKSSRSINKSDNRFPKHPPQQKHMADLKPKDLIGIPWMVAFALRADGWYLRSEIVWIKPNPMPESVKDRPTKSHEQIFLLTKSQKYYYNAEAIYEPANYDGRKDTKFKGSLKYKDETLARIGGDRWPNKIQTKYTENNSANMGGAGTNWVGHSAYYGADGRELFKRNSDGIPVRNKRDTWTINTQPFRGAHFATFPEKLVEPCILAGSKSGDIVLDPFSGSGTVGVVAAKHSRKFVGIELNLEYIKIAEKRIHDAQQQTRIDFKE